MWLYNIQSSWLWSAKQLNRCLSWNVWGSYQNITSLLAKCLSSIDHCSGPRFCCSSVIFSPWSWNLSAVSVLCCIVAAWEVKQIAELSSGVPHADQAVRSTTSLVVTERTGLKPLKPWSAVLQCWRHLKRPGRLFGSRQGLDSTNSIWHYESAFLFSLPLFFFPIR